MQGPLFTNNAEQSREWSARHILGEEERQEKKSPLEWWYRLTAPASPPLTASLAERELARRGRLTSLVLLGAVIIGTFIAIPVILLQNPLLAPGIGLLDLLFVLALWFNRRGQVYVAGVIVLVSVSIGIPASIITAPGGLSSNSMPLYDVMVQAELFAISLLPAATVFLVAALNTTFIVLDFQLQPHTADLNAMVAKAGPEVIARPILLHVIVAVVIYLWVRSAMQAIERADRAEVIAILEHDMAQQEHAIAQQKRQLDFSVKEIVAVHMRVANGDIAARVPLNHDNVLWEIAGSLNNLLSRFQRALQNEQKIYELERRLQWAKRVEHEAERTRVEIEKQINLVQQARRSQRPVRFVPTRTIIDPLLAELNEASFPTASFKKKAEADPHT
ncbi:MAG TPA: hypothetical protein VFN35_09705 [Ktedonobacteraceae bacterium]|nr:hypothetical protein [Ktedonobacteraceae bacterium]